MASVPALDLTTLFEVISKISGATKQPQFLSQDTLSHDTLSQDTLSRDTLFGTFCPGTKCLGTGCPGKLCPGGEKECDLQYQICSQNNMHIMHGWFFLHTPCPK